MDKDTEELEHELKSAEIEDYLEENRDNLRQYTLAQYLEKLLAEKGLVKAEVVKRSNLSQVYAYHIFCGYKQTPAKKKVLALSLAMELTVEETQRLLYYAGAKKLYVRDPWDSVIWHALEHHHTVAATNELLEKLHVGELLE